MGVETWIRFRSFRVLLAASATIERAVRAVVDFAVPDACCSCGSKNMSSPECEGLAPAIRILAGETVVPLIGPISVVNHPYCSSCLSGFEPSAGVARIGVYGAWEGIGWVRTGVGMPFVYERTAEVGRSANLASLGPLDLRLFSPYRMNDAVLELARLVKFGRRKSLLQLASAAMAHEFLSRIEPDRQAVLVPVPMHPSASRRRGFNQAELLAEGISALTGVPTVLALGKRIRTPPQSLTAHRNRADNVRGVFEPSGGRLDGCRVYLVDDLVTTGATVASCAAAVLSAGAGEVGVLCLARTP